MNTEQKTNEMENDNLISKKDLLNLTGISYGQLYRWKRKDLIPEEWFIRKSTFTGQETFFLKEEILERIRAKQEKGEYCHEWDVLKYHLSYEKAMNFIYRNIGQNGQYVLLHQHERAVVCTE